MNVSFNQILIFVEGVKIGGGTIHTSFCPPKNNTSGYKMSLLIKTI